MPHLLELLKGRSADPESGRIGKDIAIAFFEFPEAAIEPVILRVGNDRGIEDIVPVIVLIDLPDESLDFYSDVFGGLFLHFFSEKASLLPGNHSANGLIIPDFDAGFGHPLRNNPETFLVLPKEHFP
jgi:hypothetical protein